MSYYKMGPSIGCLACWPNRMHSYTSLWPLQTIWRFFPLIVKIISLNILNFTSFIYLCDELKLDQIPTAPRNSPLVNVRRVALCVLSIKDAFLNFVEENSSAADRSLILGSIGTCLCSYMLRLYLHHRKANQQWRQGALVNWKLHDKMDCTD